MAATIAKGRGLAGTNLRVLRLFRLRLRPNSLARRLIWSPVQPPLPRPMPDLLGLPDLLEAHVRAHLTPPRARHQPLAATHAEALSLLSGLFTQARVSLPAGYMTQPRFRAAYLLYFVPTGVATVLHVLQRSGVLAHLTGRPLRVLDLGSGPLTATLALALATDAPLDVTAVDAARQSMEDGAAILQQLRPDAKVRLIDGNLRDGKTLHKLSGQYDVILAAHVMNEWPNQTNRPAEDWLARLLAERLAPGGAVVLVEPATRHGSHKLIDIREHLTLESQLTILSPCMGSMPCPLAENTRDWCHAEQPWQRPRLVTLLDDAIGHRRATLKFSHLVLADVPTPEPNRQLFRVIGGPMTAGDTFRRYLCGADGRRVAVAERHDAGRVWPELTTAWRGDALVVPGAPAEMRRGKGSEPGWVPQKARPVEMPQRRPPFDDRSAVARKKPRR